MRIVGHGFLARHLSPLRDAHDGVVLLAAGVSWAAGTSEAEFAREADLVRRELRACRAEGSRLVFFSTASTGMYGADDCRGREDEPVVPCTPYGRHKHGLEEEIRASGADHLILRMGHVVGPGQPAHQLLPSLIRQVRAGEVVIHRGAARDLIDIDDVVALVGRLLTLGTSRDVVNIASGVPVPIEAVVERIEQRLGTTAVRGYVDGHRGNHRVSTARLRRLAGPAYTRFDADYHRRVLDKYVPLPDPTLTA
ncbi:NAD-dependent epimerase/dehydratase family protein [Streptomyces sp. Caat 7-52]|uniref:NAD-dependent epimerase/dehydratase family protein n=1 Tax=Streptomyces sp. Caat 7-52 TaxID=2949637 RepID=UPI002034AB46|nr:NAD-dependent epimerase/dehydratase family protein [Streptomyces sp. Caat 7-52]